MPSAFLAVPSQAFLYSSAPFFFFLDVRGELTGIGPLFLPLLSSFKGSSGVFFGRLTGDLSARCSLSFLSRSVFRVFSLVINVVPNRVSLNRAAVRLSSLGDAFFESSFFFRADSVRRGGSARLRPVCLGLAAWDSLFSFLRMIFLSTWQVRAFFTV